MLTGGEFMAITKGNDRPEVKDTQLFMTSADYANARAAEGAWISANKGLKIDRDPGASPTRTSPTCCCPATSTASTGRTAMPGAVGSGTFWKQATAWITGESTDDFLKNVEDSWPKS